MLNLLYASSQLVKHGLLSLSHFDPAFLFSTMKRKTFIHSSPPPTASGALSETVAAEPGPVPVLILFQFDPGLCWPLCPLSSPIKALSFIMRPIKKGLDGVRSSFDHSINPCDYPRLRGVCVCVCYKCGYLSLTLL